MDEVAAAPATALEDASLTTWIGPIDGTQYLYYPKGSLAGFLLDIMIRDASDNRRSLDDVMRELYRSTYKKGRGFTAADWWSAVSRAAGGRSFTEFNAKYIDGREPLPLERRVAAGRDAASRPTRMREPQAGGGHRAGLLRRDRGAGSRARAACRRRRASGWAIGSSRWATSRSRIRSSAGVSRAVRQERGRFPADPGAPRHRHPDARGQGATGRAGGDGSSWPTPDASAKAVRIRNGILRGKTGK